MGCVAMETGLPTQRRTMWVHLKQRWLFKDNMGNAILKKIKETWNRNPRIMKNSENVKAGPEEKGTKRECSHHGASKKDCY